MLSVWTMIFSLMTCHVFAMDGGDDSMDVRELAVAPESAPEEPEETEDNLSRTVTVTMNDPDKLTITIKGLSTESSERVLSQIENGVDTMINHVWM